MRNGRKVTTWSSDDFDLSTFRGTEFALQELEERPPLHLWISLPWGPKWITGHSQLLDAMDQKCDQAGVSTNRIGRISTY